MFDSDYVRIMPGLNIFCDENIIDNYNLELMLNNNRLIKNIYETTFSEDSRMSLFVDYDSIVLGRRDSNGCNDVCTLYVFLSDAPDRVGIYLEIRDSFLQQFEGYIINANISLYDLKLNKYLVGTDLSNFIDCCSMVTDKKYTFRKEKSKFIKPHIHYRNAMINKICDWKFYIDFLNDYKGI